MAPHEHGRNGETAAALTVALAALAAGLRSGGSFNLGRPDDFRVPDLGPHPRRERPLLYDASAHPRGRGALPGDQTFATFAFYTTHSVEELWVVDPPAPYASGSSPRPPTASTGRPARADLLDLTADVVVEELDWPQG